ncbi:MAG TPA: FkbM family methyltransferase [Bryobacteraceae bacterium]|nr:FkbM family methyltransferase [Bryobacteraceae bacterium]
MLQRALAALLRNTPYFRGKPRLVASVVPNLGMRQARVFGMRVQLDLHDTIQRDIYGGLYEPWETRWIRSYLKPGMTFVDVGANVGYFTWLAASLAGPSGRVFAFEPSALAFKKLQAVVAGSGTSSVLCQNMAVSDHEGELLLHVPPESSGNHNASVIEYCGEMTEVKVPATTLDRFFKTHGVNRVDLLKADVEGHELCVFKGMEAAARAGAVRAVLCEFNPDLLPLAGASVAQLEEWFTATGFECVTRFPSKWGPVANRLFFYRGGRQA